MVDGHCQRCLLDKEDNLHAIKYCPITTQVWDDLIDNRWGNKFFSLSFDKWID